LLVNICLHYVVDPWAERWRRHHAKGNVIPVRYADDIIAGFKNGNFNEAARQVATGQRANLGSDGQLGSATFGAR
jgi:hypothetical protein